MSQQTNQSEVQDNNNNNNHRGSYGSIAGSCCPAGGADTNGASRKTSDAGGQVINFMSKFRDKETRMLKNLNSTQFIEVWNNYDKDGELKKSTEKVTSTCCCCCCVAPALKLLRPCEQLPMNRWRLLESAGHKSALASAR